MDIGVQTFSGGYAKNSNRANVSGLQAEINQNYQAAQNYYFQKKMAFLRMAAMRADMEIQQVETNITRGMDDLIQQTWARINDTILENLDIGSGGKYKISGTFQKNVEENQEIEIPSWLIDRIKNGMDSKNIFSELGFAYEEFLEEALQEKAVSVGSAGLNDVLALFTNTGDFTANSSVRMNNTFIRPDLATNLTRETAQKAELSVLFDISKYHNIMSGKAQDLEQYPKLLLEYLKSDVFGISVKRWTNTTGVKKLTSASGIQQMINQEYQAALPHSWNFIYAYHTMLAIISRFLIDILGPVNIAYITGTGFEWATDFLSNALLFMNLYTEKQYKNNEGRPYIASGNIYINNYAQGRSAAMLATKYIGQKRVHGKGWHAYQLRFKIN